MGPGPPPYAAAPPVVPARPPIPASLYAQVNVSGAGDLRIPLEGTQQLAAPASPTPPPPAPPSVPPRPQYSASGLVHRASNLSALPNVVTLPAAPAQLPPVASVLQPSAVATDSTVRPGPVIQHAVPSVPPPDLLDADDTPAPAPVPGPSAPPRPPNPQTVALHNALQAAMRDAIARLSETHADSIMRQRAQQAELLAGGPAIADESARLTAVRDVCQSVAARWRQSVQEGEALLVDVRRRGEVSVDELVCASSIVGNQ